MVTSHIYSVFDEELKLLSRRIAEMGGMAEQMVSDSIRALVTTDAALAQRVISQTWSSTRLNATSATAPS